MDVRFDEDQELLRRTAREFLVSECPMSLVRRVMEEGPDAARPLWKAMAELGWLGLGLPEQHGGAGLGWLETTVLLEEMGRVLLPLPYLSSPVLGGFAIARYGTEAQQSRWLPDLASGARRLAIAVGDPARDSSARPTTPRAERRGDRLVLSGAAPLVPDAGVADALLVAASTGNGTRLFLVPRERPGLEVRSHPHLDATRPVAEVTLTDVELDADEALGGEGGDPAALPALRDRARAGLASETCGLAQRVLELSVEYAKTREQFGRPIGAFQAIQHKCADMLVGVESARSIALRAAWAVAVDEPDAATMACMAKAHCGEVGARVTAEGIQIHGGLGFTWEQDLHLYYRRAIASEHAHGDPDWCREQVARDRIDAA